MFEKTKFESFMDRERLECLLEWLQYCANIQLGVSDQPEYGSTWYMIERNRFESIILMRDCIYERLEF